MRKAKKVLFDVHHKLTDKASTAGRIHADADVRVAIDEVTAALKTSAATATPAATPRPGSRCRRRTCPQASRQVRDRKVP